MSMYPPDYRGLRTNLLIPSDLVPSLRIPDVTITTGEPGGVWCDRVWGRLRWSRRRVIRLPHDPHSAAKLRKRAVLNRVQAVVLPAYLILTCWQVYTVDHAPLRHTSVLLPLGSMGVVLLTALDEFWNPKPRPAPVGSRHLYLPDLPPAVADLWLQSNPGIWPVADKPKYRSWNPWAYVFAAALCASAAAGLIWLWRIGVDLPWPSAYATVALLITTLTLCYRALTGTREPTSASGMSHRISDH